MKSPKPARGFAVDGRTGKVATISHGNVQLRERVKAPGDPKFGPQQFGRKRVVEINLVIDFRHPDGIPEHDDDDDGYWFPVAHAMYCGRRSDSEFDRNLMAWIKSRMPWAADRAQQFVDKFRSSFNPRADHMTAAVVAKYVRTTEVEKRVLRLSTIAIYGMTADEYAAWLHEDEKRRDRERKAKARAKAGCLPRNEWLEVNSDSRERPWDAVGKGRTQYYESLRNDRIGSSAHGETGCSAHERRDRTGCSAHDRTGPSAPIETILATEQPVRNAAPAPSSPDLAGSGTGAGIKPASHCRKPVSAEQLSLIDLLDPHGADS